MQILRKWLWDWMINWPLVMQELENYLKKHKKFPVGNEKEKPVRDLGVWCRGQREVKGKGRLSDIQIRRLDAIGYDWDPANTQKQKRQSELTDFRKRNPDKWPSSKSKNENEASLGTWINGQRSQFNKGKLPQDAVNFLQSLRFPFDNPHTSLWSMKLEEVKTFVKNSKRFPRQIGSKDEVELGRWCSRQRVLRRKGELSKERVNILQGIKFPWSLKQ